MSDQPALLTLSDLSTLERALVPLLEYWADVPTREEAVRQLQVFGTEQFYQLALSNYFAFFQKPKLFASSWSAFDFHFSFGDLSKVTANEADLLVLGTSHTFDFRSLAKRALNLRIAEREGVEYIESYKPRKRSLSPSDLVFVPSKFSPGLTYCWVPVFEQVAPTHVEVTPERVEEGIKAVLDYLCRPKPLTRHNFKRIMLQPIGHGKLKLIDRPIIEALWNQIQAYGKSKEAGHRDERLSVELRVFSPRALGAFLESFVEQHEHMECIIDRIRPTYVRGKPGLSQRGIVAQSDKTKKVFEKAERVAKSEVTILLQGESGCGKDVVANYIHSMSSRNPRPFFPVNCSAIQDPLFESEMFGHTKSAFTGAQTDKPGYVELAGDGTLFLDEVGDLSLTSQAKLLRVLEDGTFLRVGGLQNQKMRARVIAATNKDLETEVKSGRFREDLYYRLSTIALFVPPLRERPEDLPELIDLLTNSICSNRHIPVKQWDTSAIGLLLGYAWPGNVREVRQLVEAMIAYVDGNEISVSDLRENAPKKIAAFLGASPGKSRSLADLTPFQFWYEYDTVHGGKTSEMARAYVVTDGAVSQYKKKHEGFSNH